MVPTLIFSILCFSFLLIKAADLVIVALRRLSRLTKTGVFALSAVILALGTSLPELFVAITSAMEGTPVLSLGNVLGANIANISLVAGIAGLFLGKVNINKDYIRRDVFMALVAGLLPLILILDANLSRVDGLILLSVYGAYSASFFKSRFERIAREHKKETFFYRFFRKIANIDGNYTREIGRLFIGVALLLFSADMIVKIASLLAAIANIPVLFVGLVILSIGTTLPEIAFSLRSVEEHQPTMFLGNLLGSIIANSLLILGVASIISPIVITAFENYYEAVFAFILIFSIFWLFIKSKHRLDRWEAGLLLALYLIFVIIEFA